MILNYLLSGITRARQPSQPLQTNAVAVKRLEGYRPQIIKGFSFVIGARQKSLQGAKQPLEALYRHFLKTPPHDSLQSAKTYE